MVNRKPQFNHKKERIYKKEKGNLLCESICSKDGRGKRDEGTQTFEREKLGI